MRTSIAKKKKPEKKTKRSYRHRGDGDRIENFGGLISSPEVKKNERKKKLEKEEEEEGPALI